MHAILAKNITARCNGTGGDGGKTVGPPGGSKFKDVVEAIIQLSGLGLGNEVEFVQWSEESRRIKVEKELELADGVRDNGEKEAKLGNLQQALEKVETCLKDYDKILKENETPDVGGKLSSVKTAMKSIEDAANALNAAKSKAVEAKSALGSFDYDGSIALFQDAMSQFAALKTPEAVTGKQQCEASIKSATDIIQAIRQGEDAFKQAESSLASGGYSEALTHFESAVKHYSAAAGDPKIQSQMPIIEGHISTCKAEIQAESQKDVTAAGSDGT
jgi:tetratricopeptide (TPR) repeat protein